MDSKGGVGACDGFCAQVYWGVELLPILQKRHFELRGLGMPHSGGAGKTSNEGCVGICEYARCPEKSCRKDTANTTIGLRNATLMISDSRKERGRLCHTRKQLQ